jgi:acetylornithine deacetylase/succinyl-diaminopimelate desuccinylase-like protein
MGAREDAIEQANYFHDAAQDCLVEFRPDTFVVTHTAEQAQALRDHLAGAELVTVSLGDGLTVEVRPGADEVVRRVVDSLRDEIRDLTQQLQVEATKTVSPPAPAKRAPQKRAAV